MHNMIKSMKDEQGFTLVEAIVSMAALAVISGFILQMFIVADNVNARAKAMDVGHTIVFSAIELYKSQDHADIYIRDAFFDGASVIDTGGAISIQKGYDQAFDPVVLNDGGMVPAHVKFLLEVEIAKGGGETAHRLNSAITPPGRLDSIRVRMTERGADRPEREMLSVSAVKYFPHD